MITDDFLKLMNLGLYEPLGKESEAEVQRHRDQQLAALDELIALDLTKPGNEERFTAILSLLLKEASLPGNRAYYEQFLETGAASLFDVQRAAILQRMELGFQNALAKKEERLKEAVAGLPAWLGSYRSTKSLLSAIFGAMARKLYQDVGGFFKARLDNNLKRYAETVQHYYADHVDERSDSSLSPNSGSSSSATTLGEDSGSETVRSGIQARVSEINAVCASGKRAAVIKQQSTLLLADLRAVIRGTISSHPALDSVSQWRDVNRDTGRQLAAINSDFVRDNRAKLEGLLGQLQGKIPLDIVDIQLQAIEALQQIEGAHLQIVAQMQGAKSVVTIDSGYLTEAKSLFENIKTAVQKRLTGLPNLLVAAEDLPVPDVRETNIASVLASVESEYKKLSDPYEFDIYGKILGEIKAKIVAFWREDLLRGNEPAKERLLTIWTEANANLGAKRSTERDIAPSSLAELTALRDGIASHSDLSSVEMKLQAMGIVARIQGALMFSKDKKPIAKALALSQEIDTAIAAPRTFDEIMDRLEIIKDELSALGPLPAIETEGTPHFAYLKETHELLHDIELLISEWDVDNKNQLREQIQPYWDEIYQLADPFEFAPEQLAALEALCTKVSVDSAGVIAEAEAIKASILATVAPYREKSYHYVASSDLAEDDATPTHLAKDYANPADLADEYVTRADAYVLQLKSLMALAEAAKLLQDYDKTSGHIEIRGTDVSHANRVYAALLLLQQGTALAQVPIRSLVEGCHGPQHRGAGLFHADPAVTKQQFITQHCLAGLGNAMSAPMRKAMATGLAGFTKKLGFAGDPATFYQAQVAKVTTPKTDTGHREGDSHGMTQ